MLEQYGNMFDISCDAICITTNGFVKSNGACVMGRGIAKAIQQYLPDIPYILGNAIQTKGNNVHLLYPYTQDTHPAVISFPVKPVSKVCQSHDDYVAHMRFSIRQTIPGWACKADIGIIQRSAKQLVELANHHPEWQKILIPRAGCGAGELSWADVQPILTEILDDRFIAVTYLNGD